MLNLSSHPGYIAHKVHLLVAYDLEWDSLEVEGEEEIRVHTFTLGEALAETRKDYRCDPEDALALMLTQIEADKDFLYEEKSVLRFRHTSVNVHCRG